MGLIINGFLEGGYSSHLTRVFANKYVITGGYHNERYPGYHMLPVSAGDRNQLNQAFNQ
jgi:hypothetical protein